MRLGIKAKQIAVHVKKDRVEMLFDSTQTH